MILESHAETYFKHVPKHTNSRGGLATLLEGAGYFSIISGIQKYNLFNFKGEKCVVGYKFRLKRKVLTIMVPE